MIKDKSLKKTKWGFYQFEEKPAAENLPEIYQKNYYCNHSADFKIDYNNPWVKYQLFNNKIFAKKSYSLNPKAKKSLDIGCGYGFLMAAFNNLGLEVKGIDFSEIGIRNWNKELIDNFIQGDFYKLAKELFKEQKFDIITNANVIEHVEDPEKFLEIMKTGMHNDSILAIKAPNDFSYLQEKLVNENLVDKKWWVQYPHHLSYFNKENMTNFLNDEGFEVISYMADYPIDLFLLSPEFNYVQNPQVGEIAHNHRMRHDIFMSELDENKVIKLYEAYADLGLGRNLTYFCKLKG